MLCGITGHGGFLGSFLLKIKSNFKKLKFLPFDPRISEIPKGLSVIYHLGFSSVYNYQINEQYSIKNDLDSSIKILKYCIRNSTHLVFISSSAIYDKSNNSAYKNTKLKIEDLLINKFENNFYPLSIIRPFNIYGIGQNLNFVIPQIFNSLLLKNKLIINQSNSIRDFIHVEDCINIILGHYRDHKKPVIFDLASGEPISIKNLVKKISIVTKVDYKSLIELRISSQSSKIVSKRDLPFKYKSKYSLDKGIKEMAEYFITKN